MEPAEPLGVGVRFVPRVDDRTATRRRRRDSFPDVLCALRQAEHRSAGGLENLAGTGEDLTAHQKRDEDLGVMGEVVPSTRQVILVTSVRIAGRVGVVLEQVYDTPDPLFAQPRLRSGDQCVEDPLPRLVVCDKVCDGVALGSRVLGVAAHVEVQARPVFEKDVRRSAPADHPAEQVSRDLVWTEPSLPAKSASDSVLVLEPENAPVHLKSR